jgi:plasmid stabilization system protein ParE
MKLVVYPQIDRLIDYLIDKTKLAQEEKQLKRIRTVVEKYLAEHGTMPTTRHVTQYSRASQKITLRLTRGYLELQPGTTILRYCADAK